MEELSNRFLLKYLDFPHYFLGIENIPNNEGLLLSQHRYIRDLLERFNMAGAKPNITPMCSSTPLKLLDNSTPVDAKQFRSIIGALQYVTLTRSDLAFAINNLSQFLHQPSQIHFQQLKRTLRYLKLTLNYGLNFEAQ